MAEEKGTVCVTGAGGFVASWLVKILLSQGYKVHGTVRNPEDSKNAHLKNLENAAENLKLFKADLLDYDSILAAVKGCDGVFHVASPVPSGSVPDPEVEVVKPALDGTLNVLKACSDVKVKRLVYVSSIVAVLVNPDLPKDKAIDENVWADPEYCKNTNNWYCYSKTVAERAALEYAKENGLDVVTVLPSIVLGPLLQPTINSSTLILLKMMKGEVEELPNSARMIVDVRDLAEGIKLAYEKPEAEGRYISTAHATTNQGIVEILKELYPDYNYPKKFTESRERWNLSWAKLQGLGWKYRSLSETLIDSVESYKQFGILP